MTPVAHVVTHHFDEWSRLAAELNLRRHQASGPSVQVRHNGPSGEENVLIDFVQKAC
jgi:hypothetical protein